MDNCVTCHKLNPRFTLYFYLSPISDGNFTNSVYYIYDETTMIRRDMGKDSIYDRVLARHGIDYACISCSYDLKSRDYPHCGSEKWRVNF
jgi:hypothetical protein